MHLPRTRLLAGARALVLALLGAPAAAQTQVFEFPLQPAQVVPPVASAASGSAMLSLNTMTGNGTLVATYTGLSGLPTAAHLHGPAGAGATALPIVLFPTPGGTSGQVSGFALLNAGQIADLLAGQVYFDIHSAAHPDTGELRGQVCRRALAASRNAGANPSSYLCLPPAFGGTFVAAVDLATTGHAFALLFAFAAPADVALPGGQHLLCLDTLGAGELLGGAGLGPAAGPLAIFQAPVPASLALCNLTLSSQAIHFGGVQPFALSNAQDLSLGF